MIQNSYSHVFNHDIFSNHVPFVDDLMNLIMTYLAIMYLIRKRNDKKTAIHMYLIMTYLAITCLV